MTQIIRSFAIVSFMLMFFSLFGCAGLDGRGNETGNQTNLSGNVTGNETNMTNVTGNVTQNLTGTWVRFFGSGFSFEYPSNMLVEEVKTGPNGLITGQHQLVERTGEILAVSYTDTLATYGINNDTEFRMKPGVTASSLLLQEKKNDSMGFFMKADWFGDVSTFALARDGYVAEMPFTLHLNSGTTYSGYAFTVYFPERSLLLNVRMIAIDTAILKKIHDNFMLTLRLEEKS